jgi:hypothetical protein
MAKVAEAERAQREETRQRKEQQRYQGGNVDATGVDLDDEDAPRDWGAFITNASSVPQWAQGGGVAAAKAGKGYSAAMPTNPLATEDPPSMHQVLPLPLPPSPYPY